MTTFFPPNRNRSLPPLLLEGIARQALSISPMSGVVGPDSAVNFSVNFKPLEATGGERGGRFEVPGKTTGNAFLRGGRKTTGGGVGC